jgi:hypothetical protein
VKCSYLGDRPQVATPACKYFQSIIPVDRSIKRVEPRDGRSIPLWHDSWTPLGPLSAALPAAFSRCLRPSPPSRILCGMGLWRSHLFTECLRRPLAKWNLYVLASHGSPSPCHETFVLSLLATSPTAPQGASIELCTPQDVSYPARTSTGTAPHLSKCGCSSGLCASKKPGHVRCYTTLVVCPLRTAVFAPANLKAYHTCLLAAPASAPYGVLSLPQGAPMLAPMCRLFSTPSPKTCHPCTRNRVTLSSFPSCGPSINLATEWCLTQILCLLPMWSLWWLTTFACGSFAPPLG